MIKALDKSRPGSISDHSTSVEQGVRWEIPMRGWMILNTDGAAKGNVGPAGAGEVIRNDKGEWVIGFSEYLGHCSALTAELKALIRGLKVARELGVQKLGIRVDSSVLVGMLTDQRNEHPKYHFLIQQCKQLLCEEDWEVDITHCFRETNQVADKLANIGTTGRLGVTMYQTMPMEIQAILYADSMGFLWPRHSS